MPEKLSKRVYFPKNLSRPVALFADNNFRNPFICAIFVINFVTINKHNQIGILFNSARITYIGYNGGTGNGRDTRCRAPPAQIRTCAINAYGSYLR